MEESQGWTVECSTCGEQASALLALLSGSLMGCRIDEGIRHLAPVMDNLSELSQSKPGMTSNFCFLNRVAYGTQNRSAGFDIGIILCGSCLDHVANP